MTRISLTGHFLSWTWLTPGVTGLTPGMTRLTPGVTGLIPGVTGLTAGVTGLIPGYDWVLTWVAMSQGQGMTGLYRQRGIYGEEQAIQ